MLENERKVRCVETGEIFDSVAEANAYLGYLRLIENVLNEHTANETAGGFHWEYVDEEVVEEIEEPMVEEIVEKIEEPIKEEVVEEVVKPNIFICSECGKEYKTERGLKKHIESKH